jgi:hypothetical protein
MVLLRSRSSPWVSSTPAALLTSSERHAMALLPDFRRHIQRLIHPCLSASTLLAKTYSSDIALASSLREDMRVPNCEKSISDGPRGRTRRRWVHKSLFYMPSVHVFPDNTSVASVGSLRLVPYSAKPRMTKRSTNTHHEVVGVSADGRRPLPRYTNASWMISINISRRLQAVRRRQPGRGVGLSANRTFW